MTTQSKPIHRRIGNLLLSFMIAFGVFVPNSRAVAAREASREDVNAPAAPQLVCSGAAVGDGAIVSAELFHDNTLSAWLTPTIGITPSQSANVYVRTCQNDVQSVEVLVWTEGWGATPRWVYTATVDSTDPAGPYSIWKYTVPGPGTSINMYYQFRIKDGATTGHFHAASGNFGVGAWAVSASPVNPSWKIATIAAPPQDFVVPSWMKDAVIYQIFPDRFRDGNPSNNFNNRTVYGPTTCSGYSGAGAPACIAHMHSTWTEDVVQPGYGIDFFGGDLAGITDKINAGYFNDLGVNTLYLNPIFMASSNHGYDTNNYFVINDRFGNLADFDTLMAAANAHGLRVILDMVFNHAGMDSVYIDKNKTNNGACASASSPYRAWFTTGGQGTAFNCDAGWGWRGWYSYETIPELVDANQDMRNFLFAGGSPQIPAFAGGKSVSQYWLDRGVAGFRYDVAQDITADFFQNMRPYIKQTYGTTETLMLGEVTGGCQPSGLGRINPQELDSMMNYCFRDWIQAYAGGGWTPSQFDAAFQSFRNNFGQSSLYAMMNLLSSHDSSRMISLLSEDKTKLKFGVITQMTMPGAPSVYYGDEVGVSGNGDPSNRRTYPWSDKGGSPDTGLYAHFKNLITIRNGHPALRGGSFNTLLKDATFYSFLRMDSSEKIVVILNNTGAAGTATVPVGAYLPDGAVLTDLLNGSTFTVSGGNITASVNAQWGRILRIADATTPTPTPTATPTVTGTPPTSTPTRTSTVTPTPTNTSNVTNTPTATATSTPAATNTPTATPTQPVVTCGPRTITDAASGTATNDGTVNTGEYTGYSCGINSGFGNVIGGGAKLHVDGDSAGNLNFGLVTGGGNLNDVAVIYIDSKSGGYTTTANFTDVADTHRAAISGRGTSSGQSVINFAPTFAADYAIAFNGTYAGLWQLANNGSHTWLKDVTKNMLGTPQNWELSGFSMTDFGAAAGGSFRYIATLLNASNGYRSDEFQGVAASTVTLLAKDGILAVETNPGTNPVTLAANDWNTFNSYTAVSGTATNTPTPTPTGQPTNTPTQTPTGPANTSTPTPTATSAGSFGASHDCNIFWNQVLHDTFDTTYRNLTGPVAAGSASTIKLRLRVAQNDITSARVRVWDDVANTSTYYAMAWDGAFDTDPVSYDYWYADVPLPSTPDILYYFFEINDAGNGSCAADQDFYVDDDVKFYGGGYGAMSDAYDDTRSFQITIYDPAYAVPSWMQKGIVYQIFPDRFRDGNPANNPAAGRFFYNEPGGTIARSNTSAWNSTICDPRNLAAPTCAGKYSQNFYGGDLAGVTQKVNEGYFDNLGVSVIYLNPIFESPSNHKYDTANYLKIDPDFGTKADWDALVTAASAHNMKLILDGVFNHVSSDSKYFDRYHRYDAAGNITAPNGGGADDNSGACEGGSSSFYSWFCFPDTFGTPAKDDGTPPVTVYCANGAGDANQTYTAWYGYSSLPKLQATSTQVRTLIYSNGTSSVGPYWVNQGASGWRFDVGGDVDPGQTNDPTNNYWEQFRVAVRAQYSQTVMLGEEWGDASAWLLGSEWDSVMNYRFRSAALSWMFTGCSGNGCAGISPSREFSDNDSNSGSSSGPIREKDALPSAFNARLRSIQEDYPPMAFKAMLNLADSHDTNRLRFLLKKVNNDSDSAAVQRMKEWWLFAYTYAGAPTLYYGDEVGLSQDGVWDGSQYQDDPYNRAPFPWNDTPGSFTADTSNLQPFARKMASVRNSYPALQDGDVQHGIVIDDANRMYGFARTNGSQTALIVLNRSTSAHNATLSGLNAAPYNLPDGTVMYDAIDGNLYTVSGGSITAPVSASWGIVLLEKNKIETPAAPNASAKMTGASSVKISAPFVFTDTLGSRETIVQYAVYRSATPGFTPGPSNLLAMADPAAFGSAEGVTYTDGAAAGTYYYRLCAINHAGNMTCSPQITPVRKVVYLPNTMRVSGADW